MSLTARDRKIVLVLVALAAVAGYWFLGLSPKREEAAKAADELAEQEQRRDVALARLAEYEAAKRDYASDYESVVRLGKAIPASVDTPSLIVQLERAAQGTNIEFNRIGTGERAGAATAPAATPPQPPGDASKPPAPGGTPAQSAPGAKAERAGESVNQANSQSAAAESQTGLAPGETATSESVREGGLPVGGGSTPGGEGAGQVTSVPGLEAVPFDFEFSGSFFDLADFFHDLKRFVRVANDRIEVHGRLMTIDALSLGSAEGSFPDLTAEVQATVYLTPKSEGPTAGATPAGPAGASPASGSSIADDSSGNPPTAAVTP